MSSSSTNTAVQNVNSEGAPVGVTEQTLALKPVDAGNLVMPSKQVVLADRKYKDVLLMYTEKFDGTEGDAVYGGELATLLKDGLVGFKGVNLTGVVMKIRSSKPKGSIAISFTTAIEPAGNFDDVEDAINSDSFTFTTQSQGVRFDVRPTMPTGLGTQLVPCDPAHPNVHMNVAVQNGFTGKLQVFFTISCDVIVIPLQSFLVRPTK